MFRNRITNRTPWSIKCSSEHPGNECKNIIDGSNSTLWHSQYSNSDTPNHPHTITVDFGKPFLVNGISVLPRQDNGVNGIITKHEIYVSADDTKWSSPIALGTWSTEQEWKWAVFEPQQARYVRLVSGASVNGGPWASISDLNVFEDKEESKVSVSAKTGGTWGPTINFPIIPVAAALDPSSGKLITWSAEKRNMFYAPGALQTPKDKPMDNPSIGVTFTSQWSPGGQVGSEVKVQQTRHDMFCPGTSLDVNGKIVVSGGSDAKRTSVYDGPSNAWISGPDMHLAHAYHASATCSDGRIFVIGGSWYTPVGIETKGELYDPSSRSWTLLQNAHTKPLLTSNDKQDKQFGRVYRADNHAWLFGWKNATVFQAGPSTAMNWYYTGNDGSVKSAGRRSSPRGLAADAMCGNAVMFDAVGGRILSVGGSPSYQDEKATADAHLITIGDPGGIAHTTFASQGMYYPRTFHSSVVLPDGKVLISGGQTIGTPFSDASPQLTPELYDPDKDIFSKAQANTIPRNYHSIAILLPDATVFTAGGGLSNNLAGNHADGQIYTPQYLYKDDGTLAQRPLINSVYPKTAKTGQNIMINTDSEVMTASLIRYSSVTHTMNTDQRRITLALTKLEQKNYTVTLPSDPGIIIPGYWMLFALNREGVPSTAVTLQVLI